ncbi:MAG: LD-carboxypeptidase [Victivallales bacterium]|nr:LD-carboxypeptidase [Victivallales bacterium]
MSKIGAIMVSLVVNTCLALNAQTAQDPELQKDPNRHVENTNDEHRLTGIFPPSVKTIACITPASYPGSHLHKRGLELLQKTGLHVKIMPHAFDKPEPGQVAAPLAGRLEDFYAAWNDPEVDMLLCIRGGQGCRELLAALDWKKLKERKELYLQGYSDVTQITAAMLAKGYGHPVAGPMSGSLAYLNPESIQAMKAIHHGESVGPVPVNTLVGGDCSGLAFSGLLSRLAWVAESDYCPSMAGRVIFIEAVVTTPEKIRQDFQTLLDKNFFAGAAGVVLCHFLRCGDPVQVEEVQKEFIPRFGVPVYQGFPFGHSPDCYAIDFRRRVEIRNGAVFFPAVESVKR